MLYYSPKNLLGSSGVKTAKYSPGKERGEGGVQNCLQISGNLPRNFSTTQKLPCTSKLLPSFMAISAHLSPPGGRGGPPG